MFMLEYICLMRACPPCAQCYNHHKFIGPPHSGVPLVPTHRNLCKHNSTVIRWRFMGGTLYHSDSIFFVGGLPPPQVKYCGGRCLPCSPGSIASDLLLFFYTSLSPLPSFWCDTVSEWIGQYNGVLDTSISCDWLHHLLPARWRTEALTECWTYCHYCHHHWFDGRGHPHCHYGS